MYAPSGAMSAAVGLAVPDEVIRPVRSVTAPRLLDSPVGIHDRRFPRGDRRGGPVPEGEGYCVGNLVAIRRESKALRENGGYARFWRNGRRCRDGLQLCHRDVVLQLRGVAVLVSNRGNGRVDRAGPYEPSVHRGAVPGRRRLRPLPAPALHEPSGNVEYVQGPRVHVGQGGACVDRDIDRPCNSVLRRRELGRIKHNGARGRCDIEYKASTLHRHGLILRSVVDGELCRVRAFRCHRTGIALAIPVQVRRKVRCITCPGFHDHTGESPASTFQDLIASPFP